MSFAEAVERQQDAVFRRLGEPGSWTGLADQVLIRCTEQDQLEPFGASRDVLKVRFVRVRRSQVAQPVQGQLVTRESGEVLRVFGTPVLDRKGVWTCEVAQV